MSAPPRRGDHVAEPDPAPEGSPVSSGAVLRAWLGPGARRASATRAYGVSMLIVAASTALAAVMRPHFELSNLTMVYLLGVVLCAVAFGRGPAIAASVLSVAVFNFTFVPPRFTFRVSDTQYLVTFAVMLVVAVVIGTLTAWLREQVDFARRREQITSALYRLHRDLSAAATPTGVVESARARIAGLLDAEIVVRTSADLDNRAASPASGGSCEGADLAAARATLEKGVPAGEGTPLFPEARGLHAPLQGTTGTLGVLSAYARTPRGARDPDRVHLLQALAGQVALALERGTLAEEAHLARMHAETERSRSALLSSVSHDLRTPLAAITGAASSLRDDTGVMSGATRRELAETIAEEAQRLNRLIGDLLEMTRLESGALRVRKEWHSFEEIVGAALARLEPRLGRRPVQLVIPEDLPLVPLDDVLFELVIRNLVENADKYSPPGQPIALEAAIEGNALRFEVSDRGAGLAPGEQQRVFEKFFRGAAASGRPGAGLGLAICRGIVEAHDGTIAAAFREGGGTTFTVRLPREGEPPPVEDEAVETDVARNA